MTNLLLINGDHEYEIFVPDNATAEEIASQIEHTCQNFGWPEDDTIVRYSYE